MKAFMLVLHFIGLTMGLGTGFANAFLGNLAARMNENDALKFRLQLLTLSKMGYIGIALLLISGFYMITPYWQQLHAMPLLVAKLFLALVLVILIALLGMAGHKARKGNAEVQFRKMELLGKLALLTGISIVVLAVLHFQ